MLRSTISRTHLGRTLAAIVLAVGIIAAPVSAQAATASTNDSAAAQSAIARVLNAKGKSVAEQEAQRFGVRVDWVDGTLNCGGVGAAGCYFPDKGARISLPTWMQNKPADNIRNVVRHEAAHYRINTICAGMYPPPIIPAGRSENVTDAYAVKYHGMNPNGLAYGFTANDTRVATEIHGGKCTSTQRTVTVPASGARLIVQVAGPGETVGSNRLLSRGEKITYLYTNSANKQAFVRDSKGNLGYTTTGIVVGKSSLAQATITSTANPAYTLSVSGAPAKAVTLKKGEKIRLTGDTCRCAEDQVLAITQDGTGQVLHIPRSAFTTTPKPQTPSKPQPAQPSKPSKPAAPEKSESRKTGSVQVHRFWSSKFANAHFYTANSAEAMNVRSGDANWRYEGESFRAYLPKNGTCQAGTVGIYRFWSAKFNSHFYTKNAGEMKSLRASDPNWSYEGLVFCEPTSASGNTPVYRFWSPKYQKHFFTANGSEMQKLRSSDPSWTYEGIAWYAPKK